MIRSVRAVITGKLLGPLITAVGALVLSLSVALWITSNRLDSARQSLAEARHGLVQCVAANRTNQSTISALRDQQRVNQSQREAALKAQQEAIDRARQLQDKLDNAPTIRTIELEADGDACAHTPIPSGMRRAAGHNGD